MNTIWKSIFLKYIKCYEAIETLYNYGIFDGEEKAVHEHNVLFNIIETMKTEVEE